MNALDWIGAVTAIWGAVSIMTAVAYVALRHFGWGGPR